MTWPKGPPRDADSWSGWFLLVGRGWNIEELNETAGKAKSMSVTVQGLLWSPGKIQWQESILTYKVMVVFGGGCFF